MRVLFDCCTQSGDRSDHDGKQKGDERRKAGDADRRRRRRRRRCCALHRLNAIEIVHRNFENSRAHVSRRTRFCARKKIFFSYLNAQKDVF